MNEKAPVDWRSDRGLKRMDACRCAPSGTEI